MTTPKEPLSYAGIFKWHVMHVLQSYCARRRKKEKESGFSFCWTLVWLLHQICMEQLGSMDGWIEGGVVKKKSNCKQALKNVTLFWRYKTNLFNCTRRLFAMQVIEIPTVSGGETPKFQVRSCSIISKLNLKIYNFNK